MTARPTRVALFPRSGTRAGRRTAAACAFGVPLLLATLGSAASAKTVVVSIGGVHPTVQSGVDAAAPGDTVLIKAGDYPGIVAIGTPKLTLKAKGKVIVDARSTGGAALGYGVWIIADDVTLLGIEVRNAKTSAMPGTGVASIGMRTLLRNCSFENCDSFGVEATGESVRIEKCTFRGNKAGLSIVADLAMVKDCTFLNHDTSGLSIVGVTPRILGCTVRDVKNGNAIEVGGGGAEIRKCQVSDIEQGGILVAGFAPTISNNVVRSTGEYGVAASADGATIRKNQISGTGWECIAVLGSGFDVRDNAVDGARNKRAGIGVVSGQQGVVRDNDVRWTSGPGIYLATPTGKVIVSGNTVRECSNDGGFVIDGLQHLVSKNVSMRNGGDGFTIFASFTSVADNVAKDNGIDGFDVDKPGATSNTLTNNKALNNNAEGLENNALATSFTDNVSKGNRIDVANSGTFAAYTGNSSDTGGSQQAPQID